MIDDANLQDSTLRLLVYQALKQYSTEALLPMLSDSDVIVKSAVARELQRRGGDDVFNTALALAQNVRHESREIAAFVLGQLGTPELPYRDRSIPVLKRLLSDNYYEVRSTAVSALGHLAASEVIDDVIALATDMESEVRESVAFALGFLGPTSRSLEVLNKLKEDQSRDVREWAEFALEQRGQ